MKKPNIKLMNSVHTEARIHKQSAILQVIHDVDNFDYMTYRMIESIRMAQQDPSNAEAHLCLVTQLCTITRAKLREDLFRLDDKPNFIRSPKSPNVTPEQVEKQMKTYSSALNHCGHQQILEGGTTICCVRPLGHEGKHTNLENPTGASFEYHW